MLDLRTVYINGDWEASQQHRIKQERRRLYPYRSLVQRKRRNAAQRKTRYVHVDGRRAACPIPFSDAIGKDGRVAVRMVSIDTESYAVARSHMIRLEKADLTNKTTLRKLADACGMSPAAFAKRFGYLVR